MQRFKNILFYSANPPKEKACLRRAAALATRNEAALTVVRLFEELYRELRFFPAIRPEDIQEAVIKKWSKELEAMIAPFRQQGVRVSSRILFGTPVIEVIREVLRRKHDLVMLASEGGIGERWFGSTATRLMRKCPCPVWVMHAGSAARYSRVMAAVDPDPTDAVRDGLNLKIMQLATSLAEMEHAELHVVHAWRPFSGRELAVRGGLTPREADKFAREDLARHKKWLDKLLSNFNLEKIRGHVHLIKGDPARVIIDTARRKRIDVIVMGTVARTGVAGLIIGNTAESVFHRVRCAVLAVKPEGFVTPVKSENGH
jgi:nucleotide-binding universal stress UspA family protein